MVTHHCGISTAFWGFLFHSEWVEQPVLSQQPTIRGEGLPSALPLLFSCLSLILHLGLWEVHCVAWTKIQCSGGVSMPGEAEPCLVLRDEIIGYLGPSLDRIYSPTQIFLCWYKKANDEGPGLWRNYPSSEKKDKISYPTVILDTENQC